MFLFDLTYIHITLEVRIHSFHIVAPYGRTNVRKFSLRLQGPKIFNSLSCDIQNVSNIAVFKVFFLGIRILYFSYLWCLCVLFRFFRYFFCLTFAQFSFLHWLIQSYLFLSYWMIIFYVVKKLFVFIEIVLPMPVFI